jgi:hypothetical protein
MKSHVSVSTLAQVQHPSMTTPAKTNAPAAGVRVAVTAPKALGGQVVMQRVPVDPLAGPVRPVATKTTSAVHKPAPAAKKAAPETPSLRTAADTN